MDASGCLWNKCFWSWKSESELERIQLHNKETFTAHILPVHAASRFIHKLSKSISNATTTLPPSLLTWVKRSHLRLWGKQFKMVDLNGCNGLDGRECLCLCFRLSKYKVASCIFNSGQCNSLQAINIIHDVYTMYKNKWGVVVNNTCWYHTWRYTNAIKTMTLNTLMTLCKHRLGGATE